METTETLTRNETANILGRLIVRATLDDLALSSSELDALKVAIEYIDIPSIPAFGRLTEDGRIEVKLD